MWCETIIKRPTNYRLILGKLCKHNHTGIFWTNTSDFGVSACLIRRNGEPTVLVHYVALIDNHGIVKITY